MTDLAFQDYCIICEKLCAPSAVYCSDSCKHQDELESISGAESTRSSISSMTSGETEPDFELVSPLLTPSLYYHNHQANLANIKEELNNIDFVVNSPIMLSLNTASSELDTYTFDLNYSLEPSQKMSSASSLRSKPANISDLLSSTSNNYRKWLTTACL